MAWIRPVGSLAITAASNPYVAISGLSLTLVSPGMTINIGSRTHKEGKDYSILGVNATGATVGGIPANSIQLEENFPTTNASPGVAFIIDQLSLQGNVQGTIMAQQTRILNRLEEVLGAGTAIDVNSRMIDLNKGNATALSQILWEIAGVDQFKVEQRTISGFEYLVFSATDDGTTWVDLMRFGRNATAGYINPLGHLGMPGLPSGRLTLSSTSSITEADVVGSAFVYYTPVIGDTFPQYDGTLWNSRSFTQLTLTLATQHLTNTNYDVYLAWVAGAPFIGTGPAWTSATARGTGTGTTELEVFGGYMVNKNSITLRNGATTNVIPARQALFVGGFRTTGAGLTEDSLAKRFLSNLFSPVNRTMIRRDPASSWTDGNATIHQAHGLAANMVEYFHCVAGRPVDAENQFTVTNSSANWRTPFCGVGVDSITVDGSTINSPVTVNSTTLSLLRARYTGTPGLGYHYLAMLERSDNTGGDTTAWIGVQGFYKSGLTAVTWN
jgi:hypothetical protein